jgi:NADH:ubiquinone oxidoreductase subunit H
VGYFDGLANSAFKTDAEGRELFFPYGILGKGRVLPDAETAAVIRAKIVNFYKLLMFAGIPLMVVLVNLPGGVIGVVAIGVIACIGTWLYFRSLTAGLAISGERLSYAEAQRSAAQGHSYLGLILLSILSLVFVIGGLFLLAVDDMEVRLVAIACIVLFGACLCVFLWMIAAKRRRA